MVLPATGTDFNAAANAGISDNLVQTTYDLFIRHEFNSRCVFRQLVTERPAQVPHPGSPVVLQRYAWIPEATIEAWETPLNETSDVGATKLPPTVTVQLDPAVRGAVTATTEYLKARTLAPFDAYTAESMADGAIKTIDNVIQKKIKGQVTETILGTGTESALTDADRYTSDLLRQQFTTFEEKNVPRWDGLHYLAVVHPRIIHDLRSEAGPNDWRTPKEYTNDHLLALGGEMGEYEGFRFLSNNRVIKGAGSATGHDGGQAASYNSFFVGKQALAEAEWMPLQTVIGPQVDNLRRFYTLGWKIDADWAVYQPDALDVVISSSTLG